MSNVYFTDFAAKGHNDSIFKKINRIYNACCIDKILQEGDITAVKLHFGEKGNTAYINPIYVRQIINKINEKSVYPFITDTNTLYSGERNNSVKHIKTAIENGFAFSVVNAPIIIADGINGKNYIEETIELSHFKKVKIAGEIYNSNSMVVLSHFKGHEIAGFGGAIKNLAMGCAPQIGKKEQHSTLKPLTKPSRCTGCRQCEKVCSHNAIRVEEKVKIDREKCTGCGECILACKNNAIKMNWKTDTDEFLERMAEYAYGAVKNKKDKVAYINFIMNVTPLCDCCGWSGIPIVNDIGIAASFDPVALDQASYDLVNQQVGNKMSDLKGNYEPGEDKFTGLNSEINAQHIMEYSEKIGLGTRKYNMIII